MLSANDLYEKLKHVTIGGTTCQYPMEKCEELVPLINEINKLKNEKNAVILAHSYVSPEVIYGVGDYTGDSYGLSKDAMNADCDVIVFAAVKFMAETAKILNPGKEVRVPAKLNGCSLADAITGEDVKRLKAQFPDYTFVCYINTTADVKAYCDVCVTSSNVNDIIERIPNDKIYFVPDKLMGKNVQDEMERRGVKKDIKLYEGTCYVHEDYDPDMITYLKEKHPGMRVLSHPECNSGVVHMSDFVGSTTELMKHIKEDKENDTYLLLTECGLSSRLQVENPEMKFVGSCTMCKYMKANSLQDILRVLKNPDADDIITLDEGIREKALGCINTMFEYVEGAPVGK